jgi:hypothetical protein
MNAIWCVSTFSCRCPKVSVTHFIRNNIGFEISAEKLSLSQTLCVMLKIELCIRIFNRAETTQYTFRKFMRNISYLLFPNIIQHLFPQPVLSLLIITF